MPKIRIVFIGHEDADFIEQQRRFRQRLVSPEFGVEVTSIKEGPETIGQDLDELLASQALLREVLLAEQERADAVILDCALDPILGAARQAVRIPVIGAGQAAYALAITLGDRFSILAPLRRLIPDYRRRIREYGLWDHLASIRSLDVEILELLGAQAVEAFIREAQRAVDQDGADVLVLGCTGMSPAMPELQKRVEVPIIDPAGAAIALAETLIRLKLTHSGAAYPYKKMAAG